jgi:glutamyl-tRNA(Gln) amidotransferase subunit E
VKVGLEVHQQLAVGKLFCDCPSQLSEEVREVLVRRLRPTGGENLTVDPAVAFEAARGHLFQYEVTDSDCLVEADEEPPHAINPEALRVALTVSALLHARPLDEIVVMRKIVIDGSNTSGFQRTALIAVDGTIEVEGKQYSIPSVCLEEDAARKIGEKEGEVRYRLDRLGIPLVEIATGPEITEGPEARAVAEEIGAVLRATRKVRRGIGTIREDLNVSTPGGTRIEIKGVQELRLIQKYVEQEEIRQKFLLAIRDRVRERSSELPSETGVNLTSLLSAITSGPLRELGSRGHAALGLRLPGFRGLLGGPVREGERLGRELADYARSQGLKGLLHSDELPGYGIEGPLLERVNLALACGPEDGFVLLAAPSLDRGQVALEKVRLRVVAAREGIPAETRDPLPDGRTRYSRPLPGRDRMYPETDVPTIRPALGGPGPEQLPELPRVARERIARTCALNPEVVSQIIRQDALEPFEALVSRGFPAPAVARLLAQDVTEGSVGLPEPVRELRFEELEAVLQGLGRGQFAKEGVPKIIHAMLEHGSSVEAAAARVGLAPLSREELERLTEALLDANAALLQERGERAVSALMGDLMQQVRGRRDGREVAQVLEAGVRRRTAVPPT